MPGTKGRAGGMTRKIAGSSPIVRALISTSSRRIVAYEEVWRRGRNWLKEASAEIRWKDLKDGSEIISLQSECPTDISRSLMEESVTSSNAGDDRRIRIIWEPPRAVPVECNATYVQEVELVALWHTETGRRQETGIRVNTKMRDLRGAWLYVNGPQLRRR
ncbi:hypothetical protein M407DRAFT_7876 [Tulasnella calospora MUT 4182]|uniref:Uncharacterized protein n=1 Tax=Tulasnella calospora MUT 4182 TaxID=1051891 RepID=A0A0C3QJL6_9AGAM|nr:hypothetical protein M407DRAFT_7876 [Tulasnella calospora MUT 4182]